MVLFDFAGKILTQAIFGTTIIIILLFLFLLLFFDKTE